MTPEQGMPEAKPMIHSQDVDAWDIVYGASVPEGVRIVVELCTMLSVLNSYLYT